MRRCAKSSCELGTDRNQERSDRFVRILNHQRFKAPNRTLVIVRKACKDEAVVDDEVGRRRDQLDIMTFTDEATKKGHEHFVRVSSLNENDTARCVGGKQSV